MPPSVRKEHGYAVEFFQAMAILIQNDKTSAAKFWLAWQQRNMIPSIRSIDLVFETNVCRLTHLDNEKILSDHKVGLIVQAFLNSMR